MESFFSQNTLYIKTHAADLTLEPLVKLLNAMNGLL